MTTPPVRSAKAKRRNHTKAFKQEAVRLAQRPEVGFARASKDLGIHESLLRTWAKANQRWVTDITYVPTAEGWLYLSAIMDLHSRRIVGWAMAATMHRDLVLKALEMAVADRRPGEGLVHHSDRGSQYASDDCKRPMTPR